MSGPDKETKKKIGEAKKTVAKEVKKQEPESVTLYEIIQTPTGTVLKEVRYQ